MGKNKEPRKKLVILDKNKEPGQKKLVSHRIGGVTIHISPVTTFLSGCNKQDINGGILIKNISDSFNFVMCFVAMLR